MNQNTKKTLCEKSGLEEALFDAIFTTAEKYKLHKVVLFGSRARGDYRATSDINLAIAGGDTHAFMAAIDEAANTMLSINIVDMERLQSQVEYGIKQDGICIYELD